MNWRIIAIPASMIPIIIIAIQFDIKAEDVFAIGIIPFAGAVAAMIVKLGLQGVKFSYIARHYLGPIDSIWKMSGVRIGSEFIKFTTPMFVGAEFVVIYWMHKKGVPPSKAMWVAILDIVTEVFAGGMLSIMAGIIALLSGAYVVAAIILSTSVFVTSLWMILFFLSAKRTFQLPKGISKLVMKFGKEKGEKFVDQTNLWMEEICTMSRQNLKTKESNKVFLNGFALSILSWIFYGITFMIIASGTGYFIDVFDSIMAVMGANAIGNLPITIGGSGLAEFGIVAYLNHLNPFDFDVSEGSIEWNAVIAWRIATYYVPIGITWFLLIKLALSKYTKPDAK
ncbi:MAG TPA: lysylphosphatidylglycerol synthase transmembrane domain-containing protein [Nitrosarchaeum sp.]|nr:lysylphosphatidylglycerol synthase transmembrane domain-containing protein [Nitrosarchaeum sp.]